jgi:propanol-preferring alcohol dehydrogenase
MASPSGSPHDLRDTLEFSVTHGILPQVRPITLDQAPETLDAMASGRGGGVRSVITFG